MKGKKYFRWLAVIDTNNGYAQKEWAIVLNNASWPIWAKDAYYDAARNHYYNVILRGE